MVVYNAWRRSVAGNTFVQDPHRYQPQLVGRRHRFHVRPDGLPQVPRLVNEYRKRNFLRPCPVTARFWGVLV